MPYHYHATLKNSLISISKRGLLTGNEALFCSPFNPFGGRGCENFVYLWDKKQNALDMAKHRTLAYYGITDISSQAILVVKLPPDWLFYLDSEILYYRLRHLPISKTAQSIPVIYIRSVIFFSEEDKASHYGFDKVKTSYAHINFE